MSDFDPTSKRKSKLLLFAFLFLLVCACIFSGMGYYYLTYRNTLMKNAVVRSGTMSVWMFAQDLEKNILALENKMILDVVSTPDNSLNTKNLNKIKKTPSNYCQPLLFYAAAESGKRKRDSPAS